MKSWMWVIGVIVVLVVLFSSSVVGAALCMRGIGCIYSTDNGVKADSSKTVTISVNKP